MVWSEILIILTSALGATYIFSALESKHKDAKNLCLLSLISVILFQVNKFLAYDYSWIVSEVLNLSIFSLILIILLITVRKLKPEFARYPYVISFFPILIPFLYPLISGNESIIQLVLQLLQIAALLSVIFLLVSQFEEKRILLLTAIAVVLFMLAGILYWFEEQIQVGYWLWQSLAAIGIGIISYSITKFFNQNTNINRYGHQ